MPSHYLTRLAKQAYDSWHQIEEGVEKIKCHIPEQQTSATDLADKLALRPDLQARIAWYLGYTPSKWLLEGELDEVKKRREALNIDCPKVAQVDAYARAKDYRLMGLCLSGGGIRSATFSLGVLQGLAELKLLRCFDYLSSVSGGGYIHQWLAAWSKHEQTKDGFENLAQKLIPLPEPCSPQSHPEPIRWLRRYSNYLTPERGFFTADTWVGIT